MHRLIATRLRQKPELLDIARENLAHWLNSAGKSTPYLTAWRNILDHPMDLLLPKIQAVSDNPASVHAPGRTSDCRGALASLRRGTTPGGPLQLA